jgi:hypothetical protein
MSATVGERSEPPVWSGDHGRLGPFGGLVVRATLPAFALSLSLVFLIPDG